MDARTRLSIAILMLLAFTVGTDFTGAIFLVPPIERDFAADITTTQWVLNVYALTFSMLMVAGGRLGDMYGHKRLMAVGGVIFIAASLACFFAPSIGALIAARAAQGVGAAMLWPTLIARGSTVVDADRRGLALGLILAGVTTGNVVGPLIGGVVVSLGDWRLFFLANTVLMAAATLLVFWLLPKDTTPRQDERIDFAGMAVLSAAVLALLYALDVGASWGWQSPAVLGLFGLSFVLFVVLPLVEQRIVQPLLPPVLLRNREFLLALATNGLIVPSIFIGFLYFPQYLQKTIGLSALEASFGIAPLMVLLAIGSIISGNFYKPVGPKRLLLLGFVLAGLGAASVVVLAPSQTYLALLPAMLLIGLGGAITVGTAGTAVVSAVASSRAGLAGGLSFMFHLAFGAICVAAATAVMFISSAASLRQGLARAGIDMSSADQAVINASSPDGAAARAVLGDFDPETVERIRAVLNDAFATGLSSAYWIAVATALTGVLAVLALDERKLTSEDSETRTA